MFPTLKKLYVGATIQKAFKRWIRHILNVLNLKEARPVGATVVKYLMDRATNEGTASQDYLNL